MSRGQAWTLVTARLKQGKELQCGRPEEDVDVGDTAEVRVRGVCGRAEPWKQGVPLGMEE